jgi:hypothetical protein
MTLNESLDAFRVDPKLETIRNEITIEDRNFEGIIQHELQKLGYEVDYRVGNSDYKIDLAVRHPDDHRKYILGIETDGLSLLSAKSLVKNSW